MSILNTLPVSIKSSAPLDLSRHITDNMNAMLTDLLDDASSESIAHALGLRIVPEGTKSSVPLYQIAFGCEAGVFVSTSHDDISHMVDHFNNMALTEATLEERMDPDTFFRSRCGAILINNATELLEGADKGSRVRGTMQGHYTTLTNLPRDTLKQVAFGDITLHLHRTSAMTAVYEGRVIGGYLKGNLLLKPEYRGKGLGAAISAAKTFMPISNNHYLAVSSGEYSEAGFRTKVAALRMLRDRFDLPPVSDKVIADLHAEGVDYHQKVEGLRSERRTRHSDLSP